MYNGDVSNAIPMSLELVLQKRTVFGSLVIRLALNPRRVYSIREVVERATRKLENEPYTSYMASSSIFILESETLGGFSKGS